MGRSRIQCLNCQEEAAEAEAADKASVAAAVAAASSLAAASRTALSVASLLLVGLGHKLVDLNALD